MCTYVPCSQLPDALLATSGTAGGEEEEAGDERGLAALGHASQSGEAKGAF